MCQMIKDEMKHCAYYHQSAPVEAVLSGSAHCLLRLTCPNVETKKYGIKMYTLNSQMENKFSTIIDIRFQIIPNFRLVFDTERQVKRCF